MDGDPRDREVDAAQAEAAARAEAAELAKAREAYAVLFGLAETQARRGLEVAGIVFGLTIAFVVPTQSISEGELWLLTAAIILLGLAILVGLGVVVEATHNAVTVQHQSDADFVSNHEVFNRQFDLVKNGASASLLLCALGIASLTCFALLHLPDAT